MPPEDFIRSLETIKAYALKTNLGDEVTLKLKEEEKKDNKNYRNSRELTMLYVMSNRDHSDNYHTYYKRMAGHGMNGIFAKKVSISLGSKSVCLDYSKFKKYEKLEVKKTRKYYRSRWLQDNIGGIIGTTTPYTVLDGQQFIRASDGDTAFYRPSQSSLSTVNNYAEDNRELRRRVDILQEQIERLTRIYGPQGTIN